jgi:hypothetical protein
MSIFCAHRVRRRAGLGDMLISCGEEWAGGQARGACSFLRGTCSFFRPRPGHIGDMSWPWSVGRACPVTSDADAGHGPGQGTCSFFSQDMLVCCAAGLVGGQGCGTCSFFGARGGLLGEPVQHAHSSRPGVGRGVGHAHSSWPGVGWWASPRSMLILAGDMLIFRAKAWTYGGHVQALARGEGMSRGGPPSYVQLFNANAGPPWAVPTAGDRLQVTPRRGRRNCRGR